jgi:hypothetical protein
MWAERPELSQGAALAEICRRYVAYVRGDVGKTSAKTSTSAGSRSREVISTCDECKKSTRETRRGSLEISKAIAERIRCDAEILDIRNGPAPLRRSIPPKTANFIDGRDKGRCRFPGCSNRTFIDRHHEGPGGWRAVGHDPKRVLLLCDGHHGQRHDGIFTIEGDANAELTFRLADGTKVEVPRELAEVEVPRELAEIEFPRELAEIEFPRELAEVELPRELAEVEFPREPAQIELRQDLRPDEAAGA